MREEGKLAGGGGQAGWGWRASWLGVEGRLAGGGGQANIMMVMAKAAGWLAVEDRLAGGGRQAGWG